MHLKLFYSLTKENVHWMTTDGLTLHSQACNHLVRIYTTIAKDCKEIGDQMASLDYLVRAFEMAKEGTYSIFCIFYIFKKLKN